MHWPQWTGKKAKKQFQLKFILNCSVVWVSVHDVLSECKWEQTFIFQQCKWSNLIGNADKLFLNKCLFIYYTSNSNCLIGKQYLYYMTSQLFAVSHPSPRFPSWGSDIKIIAVWCKISYAMSRVDYTRLPKILENDGSRHWRWRNCSYFGK